MQIPSSIGRRNCGFSLIELLTVIAIIGIMGAIIGVAVRPNEGASMRSSQRVMASLFQAARTIATTKQTEARLIIFKDGPGPDAEAKRLRFVGIVYWGDNPTTPAPDDFTWVPANDGQYLPPGAYYVPANKFAIVPGDGVTESDILASGAPAAGEFDLSFPTIGGSEEDEWYYYAFDQSGSARTSTDTVIPGPKGSFAGAVVALVAGRPSGDGETITVENPFSAMGLAVRRTGTTMVLNEYDYLEDAVSSNP